MATIKDLEKYLDYKFSSGPYTGQDYKTFQTKYINYLRTLCKQNGWELVNIGRNHYCSQPLKTLSSHVYLLYCNILKMNYITTTL